jgi:tRNA G18 (ribose-2'-O)-methylase SpoU
MIAATEGTKKKEGVPQAIAAMKARGGRIEYVSKHDLNLVTDNKPHQVRLALSTGQSLKASLQLQAVVHAIQHTVLKECTPCCDRDSP